MNISTRATTVLLNEVHDMRLLGKIPWRPRRPATLVALVALGLAPASLPQSRADDAQAESAFHAEIRAQAALAEKEGRSAIAGAEGWIFFVAELRALSVGPFWAKHATAVSRATDPQNADPLPAIVDFAGQLQRVGIELVIVPVPAKAAVYPELVSKRIKAPSSRSTVRLDPDHAQFYRLLSERGIAVLDLTSRFLEQRQAAAHDLYCKTDSHWSGQAIELTARAIANHVRDRPWLKVIPRCNFETEPGTVEIAGDLARMLDETHPARETVHLTFVGTKRGGRLTSVEPSRASPVLLLGDSHTLVFHDPELYARGAGLPDLLAHALGFPVDLVGIRGSAATTTRIELLRRRDNLSGKKLVIWCFSCREFTESSTGWRKVPVIRSARSPSIQ
jgi:alginate O-acetyltransferase complex protein AlgJ